MRKLSRKGKVFAATAAVALVAASGGAAYAYWTTTGTGSGAASNSSGGGTVTLHATFNAGLAPGNATAVAYTADNGSNTGTVVGALTATVSTSDPAHCLASWFDVTAVTSNSAVAPNSTGTSVGSGTLTFKNDAANQDSCKSATITITVGSV